MEASPEAGFVYRSSTPASLPSDRARRKEFQQRMHPGCSRAIQVPRERIVRGFGKRGVEPFHLEFTAGSSTLRAARANWAPMENLTQDGDFVKSPAKNLLIAIGLVAIGLAIGAAGIYVGDTDDAPGAALIGLLLMVGAIAFGVKFARRKT